MLNTNDLSPPNVKSMRTQPAVVDDRTEFRPSLRQPPVFHPNDDFESWEFAVSIYLASVPERSMGPYILSFLNEEAARMFRSTGVRPTAPAPVIWETLRQLFEKLELPAVYRERFFSRRQRPEESVDSFLRDLRELVPKAFKQLNPVSCERNICERFCMGLRNRDLRNKFILKPAESLSVALIKARGCEALEQFYEKRAAEESICLAFSQHSLNPKQTPDQIDQLSRRGRSVGIASSSAGAHNTVVITRRFVPVPGRMTTPPTEDERSMRTSLTL
ncbi:hypothetical protein EG68_11882 [Paragonimus skrjabini miyazakii]|uniref:Retrotransposon gag domain-containing protein n=1 Tax=Paragonimus skrjabini miyazakii TaxID=59628 RepID=A0A8S9YKN3_9TREM|nr:hypothetical protein EG68_11882 [Paragonimus skrjabini miyazakii]